ncbi:MAG TPA: 2-oxo-4-hydroxy-4-carboxy-5-ureidoimidazoline decarboxylase [Thermomonospora sp.]|nr:2-oxo-4-hydroxy-4-carboxy-5-ureidoimidazoline decarboxylase [Thermomonospora sp.]
MPDTEDLGRFNALAAQEAERELLACCASRRWAREIAGGRPYGDLAALREAGVAAVRRLEWPDVAEALAAHPRIGATVTGRDRESSWSRGEQAGVAGADETVREALREGNRAYEERFGHVFLICASGRDAATLLAALRDRLGNDADTERAVVRGELAEITGLRLGRLFGKEAR